ncbi:BTB/POZ domain-containing protein [Cocos nucifera]|uniref:BTB/POZ domain-containing protein n=1 Tax=Cocos nucifera TaxID=13894 RepID=A0A8K0MVJ2_COCNU|nr:BTB/POZ domain-containing protein [Cocos nucifera]
MELPRKKTKGDGRKTLRDFTEKELIPNPDQPLRVRIVSKPQPDDREHIGTENSRQPEAERSDNVNNREGSKALRGIYISRQSRSVDFSTSGDHTMEIVINVDSSLLSFQSYLFRKLFSEMKRESPEKPLTIQIEASEENAFIGLLEFIHSSSMPLLSYEEILDLLLVSDKFQVLSCAQECIRQLVWKPNSELSCFELCDKVHWASIRELLAREAMDYVTQTIPYRMTSPKEKEDCNIMSIENELLQLPFSAIKAVFRTNSLDVESEDVVYDFMLYWARIHYPKPEDHYAAKELHLERLIRIAYLTHQKLEEALQCDFFYPESISKAVLEALDFKVREPYCRRCASPFCSSDQFLERKYRRTPIMVTRLPFPEFDCCNVYFSLTKNELWDMFFKKARRESQDFQFGHQLFSLAASWNEDGGKTCFGLSITAKAKPWDDVAYATRFLAMIQVDDRVEFFERSLARGKTDLIPAKFVPRNGFSLQRGHAMPELCNASLHWSMQTIPKR